MATAQVLPPHAAGNEATNVGSANSAGEPVDAAAQGLSELEATAASFDEVNQHHHSARASSSAGPAVEPQDDGPDQEGAPAQVLPTGRAAWLRVVLRSHLERVQLVWRLQYMQYSAQVHYTWQFKVLLIIVFGMSVAWIMHYLLAVLPVVQEHHNRPCRVNDNHQLTYDARMLFLYFVWFACARGSLFIPCIAMSIANVQTRSHGFCRTYLVHLLLRDGPLYIFLIASLLFLVQLMQSPDCGKSPKLFAALNFYAVFSCVLSMMCFILSIWHNKVLNSIVPQAHAVSQEERGAPPNTIRSLESLTYDPAVFGDEEDKPYPAECAICLLQWEQGDAIKVTPCTHAFHEECLGNWLQGARTCPVCRLDLTKPDQDGNNRSPAGVLPRAQIGRPAGAPQQQMSNAAADGGSPAHSNGSSRVPPYHTRTSSGQAQTIGASAEAEEP